MVRSWSSLHVPVPAASSQLALCRLRSGRLVCSGFCAHGVWVSGVTVYGTPTGHTHAQGRSVANDLLSLALDRVLQLSGPRFIAGDFNHDLDHLSTVAMMERLGFKDIQDIHAERTGVLPVATCRGKTRRDYMFVSRELAGLFLRCHVDDESVSDHSYPDWNLCWRSNPFDQVRVAYP